MSPLNQTSENLGLEAVKSFLKTVGIRPEALVLDDGSGLSRSDMITAEATVQLLTFMSKHRYATVFRDALPIAGVDGTLRNRMQGTAAENNVRAKTGSLSSAASLGGYVTTQPARSSRLRSWSTTTHAMLSRDRCASIRSRLVHRSDRRCVLVRGQPRNQRSSRFQRRPLMSVKQLSGCGKTQEVD